MKEKNNYVRGSLALLLAAALSACGGGGGNPGVTSGGGSGSGGTGGTPGTPAVPAAPTVAVSFVNASGQASNSLSGATPLTVRALVRDQAGKPVPNALVSFATDPQLAVFSPTAGTSLTDANGVATVTLRAASLSAGGAGKVTATTAIAGTTITSEGNYSVGATALTFSTLRLSQSSISAYGSTEVSVDVLANGAPYTAQSVNVRFSSACATAGKATLAATTPTNQGKAMVVYRDQGCGNDDTITASADGVTISVSETLKIAAPAAASVQFVSAAPVEKSIVIRGQGGISRTETATLRYRVFDIFDRPLVGQRVDFSVVPNGVVTLNKTSDTTDQNGEVITTVNSLDMATTFRIQATLPQTATATRPNISTLSDSIVVTTGLPVQRSLSLSTSVSNVEGWRDSGTNTPASVVSILLADQSGNPVADGTPIVFQTNLGAIGSSNKGGCTTVNGGCSVDFRVQEPRVAQPNTPATPCNTLPGGSSDSLRPGLATICASTTDGTNTQFGKTSIFFSSGYAENIFMNGSATALPNRTVEIGPVPSANPLVFTLQLNDLNLNPLPAGSTVQVTAALNATAVGVVPAIVPDILPHNAAGVDDHTGSTVSGPQGSTHRFTISSTAPTPCVASSVASFDVTVTTPKGRTTSIPFRVTFSCP